MKLIQNKEKQNEDSQTMKKQVLSLLIALGVFTGNIALAEQKSDTQPSTTSALDDEQLIIQQQKEMMAKQKELSEKLSQIKEAKRKKEHEALVAKAEDYRNKQLKGLETFLKQEKDKIDELNAEKASVESAVNDEIDLNQSKFTQQKEQYERVKALIAEQRVKIDKLNAENETNYKEADKTFRANKVELDKRKRGIKSEVDKIEGKIKGHQIQSNELQKEVERVTNIPVDTLIEAVSKMNPSDEWIKSKLDDKDKQNMDSWIKKNAK